MNQDQKKAAVRRYYDEVWCKGNVKVVDELLAEQYENCDPATPGTSLKGRDAFKSLVATYREAFPDLRLDIGEQWSEGDKVISRWEASGTHRGALMGIAATGIVGKGIAGVTISTFASDRIAKDEVVWDTLGLLRQLGAVPA